MPPPSVIDITLPPYNAVPGTDCWPAFQQACDDCLADSPHADGYNSPHSIYVPGNALPYLVSRPILADAQKLSFVGDGAYQSVIQTMGFSDVLQFGVPRNSQGQILSPATNYWVDSTNYLDAAAGQRYGLRTLANAYAYFQGTPFDTGPAGTANWSLTRQLTIDFAVYNPAGWYGGDQGIRLFGLGDPDNERPSPFYCGVIGSSTTIYFDFATSDGSKRRATFPLPAGSTMLQRISIQLDLVYGNMLAFVNGIQVEVLLSIPLWPTTVPLLLQANEYRAFQLGTCLVDAAFNPGTITDQIVFGFKITGKLLYQDTGDVQTRIDGHTIDDAQQFFAIEQGAFCTLLPLQDSGNAYRSIPWAGAQTDGFFGFGHGLFLHATSLTVPDTRLGNSVRGLTLSATTLTGFVSYGRALCHGPLYDFAARDCIFTGGAHNFGALNGAVGYPIKVSDCEFDYGGDAAIYSQGNIWFGERLTIKYWGREAVRAVRSMLDLRQVFYAPPPSEVITDCVLKLHDSSGAVLDAHLMDFEGGGPGLAHIYCDAGVNDGPTFLTLRNINFGTQAAGYYIVLSGANSVDRDHGRATLSVEECSPNDGSMIQQPIPGVWVVKFK